jgi:hypothetical protein
MKRILVFILVGMVNIAGLSGCGRQIPAVTPTADGVVEFDEQGIAMLRGYVASGTSTPGKGETISIDVPVKMDSMDVAVNVPFNVTRETIISSTTTKQTDVLEYLSFNQGSLAYEAFPINALVEVIFRNTGTGFEAISMHEVKQGFRLFRSSPKIDPVFTMENFAQGTLNGHISQSIQQNDGTVLWKVSMPVTMHGHQAAVVVWVQSALDTKFITTSGTIAMVKHVMGDVQIRFTRSKNTLTAHQVTIITPP